MAKQNQFQRKSVDYQPDLFLSLSKEREVLQSLQGQAKEVVKQCFPDTDKLIQSIEAMGLPVLTKGPETQFKLALLLVGSQPGFMPPTMQNYDSLVNTFKKSMRHKAHLDFSQGFLLIPRDKCQFSYIVYHFYHWMAFSKGFKGYDDQARNLYQVFTVKYNSVLTPKFLERLDIQESTQLRWAIRRDKEALQFLQQVRDEIFIPVNNAKLMESGRAQA